MTRRPAMGTSPSHNSEADFRAGGAALGPPGATGADAAGGADPKVPRSKRDHATDSSAAVTGGADGGRAVGVSRTVSGAVAGAERGSSFGASFSAMGPS